MREVAIFAITKEFLVNDGRSVQPVNCELSIQLNGKMSIAKQAMSQKFELSVIIAHGRINYLKCKE